MWMNVSGHIYHHTAHAEQILAEYVTAFGALDENVT